MSVESEAKAYASANPEKAYQDICKLLRDNYGDDFKITDFKQVMT